MGMLTVPAALELLTDVISDARRAGATAADAVFVGDAAIQASVRQGKLEEIERSEGAFIDLRVFVGSQTACETTSDLSPQGLSALVYGAVALAKATPPDPYADLAPEELLLKGGLPDLDLDDPTPVSPERLKLDALAAEEAGRSVPGVVNSEGASATAGQVTTAMATSHGLAQGYRTTSHSVTVTTVAKGKGGVERDYDYAVARHRSDLEAAEVVGRRAGERTVNRLDPTRLTSERMPVVFDRRLAPCLIGHLISAISGTSVARRTSFLLDARGERVFAPGVTIREEPLRPRGMRSRPIDGEGLPTRSVDIVSDGILNTWLLDSTSARQLRERPTGHASRGASGPPGTSVSNVMLMPGTASPTDILSSVRRGLYVVELTGMSINGMTGEYSRGAAGFLIENGELTRAVSDVMISSNLKDMFATMIPADDLELRYGIDAPTVLIPQMTVGGRRLCSC